MKRIILLLLLMFGSARAYINYSEQLEVTTVSAPDQWTNTGGASKVASVTDATDANYVYDSDATNDSLVQRFILTNPTTIPTGATIDSLVLNWRGQDNGTGSNNARANVAYLTQTYVGTTRLLGTSWSDYTQSFTKDYGGSSDWTLTTINNCELEVETVALGSSRQNRCTRLYAIVYFHTVNINYETVIHNDINDLAGNFSPACWRPLIMTSTNNIYARFAGDYRQVQEKAYSTNGGSTWAIDSLTIATGVQYTDDDYCFGSNVIADTFYLSLPQNTTLNFLMGKIYNNSLVLMDTVFGGTTPAYNSSIFPIMNYNGNQMTSLRRTGGALHDFIADSTNGRLAQGVGWGDGSTAADSIEPTGNILSFPILGGVALYAVNDQDLYFHNGSDWFASGTDILPIPDQDNEAMYFLAYSLTDSNFVVTYEENDTVFCIRAKLSGASFTYTAIDTTIVEGGDNWASTDAALECRYPTCSFLGTRLIVFYCSMPDTTNLNNISIVYKTSTDYGATFGTADTLHRATDSDYIQNLNSPPYFNDDANDLVCVAWTDGADRLGGDTGWELFFAADSLKMVAAGVYTGQVIIVGGD